MKLLPLTLFLAMLAGPLAAQAISQETTSVPIADLNLSTTDGLRALDIRLKHAVRTVCADLDYPETRAAYRSCLDGATASATTQRENMLRDLAARRSGSRSRGE